ncbi:MAG TPA: tetratricopeptide repeat protein [Ktedonobacteraceae bacterium]|nr:tetratricopeptide repeat protein [Ktedonobacteraceae bacterium]
MTHEQKQPISIFCAYAPEDERLYQELAVHFRGLSNRGLCILRHARDIALGSESEQALISLVERAELVLVLLSSDYFRSPFSTKSVLQDVLASKAAQACLIPILLRPCFWQDSLFGGLMLFPRDGLPVSSRTQRDTVWLALVEETRTHMMLLFSRDTLQERSASLIKSRPETWVIPYRRNSFFTGREIVLKTLYERLHAAHLSGSPRVLALSGLAGIGKTQLALEYAYRYRHDYRAVFWVTAETPEVLLVDVLRLAEQLGLLTGKEQATDATLHLFKDWLHRNQDWLLIFDNVGLIESVAPYLPVESGRNGHVLLTTRAMAAGGLAEIVPVEEMRGPEGTLLLLHRAGLLMTGASLEQVSEQIRNDAERIVAEMDGLALAIDQAGAYIGETGCSLERYLHLFHECRARLLVQRGTLPVGHPESVATTWKLVFQKIERTPADDLLHICAFLAPDAIPEALLAHTSALSGSRMARFAADPLALDVALARLRNHSLLKRNADSNSISLHRLLQAVVRDNLKPAQRQTWAIRTVQVLSQATPDPETISWQTGQQYLSQIVAGTQLIEEYHLVSRDAGWLLKHAGTMLKHVAHYREAERMYEKALTMLEMVHGPEHLEIAMTLSNLAQLLGIQRKYEQAVSVYEKALHMREGILGPEHPDVASILDHLALLYSNWERYGLAQSSYERALQIREHTLGSEHPDTATTLDKLAVFYRLGKNYGLAEPLFKRALSIREHALGPEHPMTASALNNLAVLYRSQGNYTQARPLFERALQIHKQTRGSEHPAVATALSNLAYLVSLQGQYEQALDLYRQALFIRERAFGSEHPNTTVTWLNIGQLSLEMKLYEQAEDALQCALLTHEQALGKDHPRVARVLEVYGQLLHAIGREEEAKQYEERAQAIRKR